MYHNSRTHTHMYTHASEWGCIRVMGGVGQTCADWSVAEGWAVDEPSPSTVARVALLLTAPVYVTWLIHMWHDSAHVTWLIHSCHSSLLCWRLMYTCHDSFKRDMTHSYVTWLIHMWHDSFMRDMTHSCMTWPIHMWHDSFTHKAFVFPRPTFYYTWRDSFICEMPHSYVT